MNARHRTTNMQRARDTDYGGEIRFVPSPGGGWVAGRSWMRWPGLPMPFQTMLGYTDNAARFTREWDVMVSYRVLQFSVTVERVPFPRPFLVGSEPRAPLFRLRPLPERIREGLTPLRSPAD